MANSNVNKNSTESANASAFIVLGGNRIAKASPNRKQTFFNDDCPELSESFRVFETRIFEICLLSAIYILVLSN